MSRQQTTRLAVVDADSGFATVLARRAEAAGWEVVTHRAPVAPERLVAERIGAVALDPATLGDELGPWLERLRELAPEPALLVCAAPSTVRERVRGLRRGADDWLTKPCHPEEALARLEAILRRRRPPRPHRGEEAIFAADLEICPDRFQAYVAGRSLELTRREFELLRVLAEARGRVLEREEVYARVWGWTMARGDRSVDVFVRKLRRKLGRLSPGWAYIHTHFGVGYRFEPEPLPAAPGPDLPDPGLVAEPRRPRERA